MKYHQWTNVEIRRLRAAHANGVPSRVALAAMFPRHPEDSILSTARSLGFYRRGHVPVRYVKKLHWMRVAHEHFARRESGLLA